MSWYPTAMQSSRNPKGNPNKEPKFSKKDLYEFGTTLLKNRPRFSGGDSGGDCKAKKLLYNVMTALILIMDNSGSHWHIVRYMKACKAVVHTMLSLKVDDDLDHDRARRVTTSVFLHIKKAMPRTRGGKINFKTKEYEKTWKQILRSYYKYKIRNHREKNKGSQMLQKAVVQDKMFSTEVLKKIPTAKRSKAFTLKDCLLAKRDLNNKQSSSVSGAVNEMQKQNKLRQTLLDQGLCIAFKRNGPEIKVVAHDLYVAGR